MTKNNTHDAQFMAQRLIASRDGEYYVGFYRNLHPLQSMRLHLNAGDEVLVNGSEFIDIEVNRGGGSVVDLKIGSQYIKN